MGGEEGRRKEGGRRRQNGREGERERGVKIKIGWVDYLIMTGHGKFL